MSARLFSALLCAIALGACGRVQPPPPQIPTVRLDFETNLTAAVECQYLGQVLGPNALVDAERREANLILEFIIDTSTTNYNGVITTSKQLKGTALKCPPETVQKLVSAQGPRS